MEVAHESIVVRSEVNVIKRKSPCPRWSGNESGTRSCGRVAQRTKTLNCC